MNKREKELFQRQLDSEEAVIKELEKEYRAALKSIDEKIKLLQSDELTESRIYQIEYQKALRGQIEGILDKMHGDEFSTIQKYLHDCYEDGFIGTAYSLAGQGMTLILPIDQAAAVKAIMTDSKLKEGLYDALGVDVKSLKKTIASEITRGIATGQAYSEIARNISNASKAPFARAKTIARTEGHRIQEASTYDAQKQAISKGADVVKSWDSTMDGNTRPVHRQLDGQIREVDEPFTAGGLKAMYPGGFGNPAEDCNCRCKSLTRARKALDAEELQTMKERAEYFGLDKTKDFEDFKAKYLTASKMEYLEQMFKPVSSIEEAAEFARKELGLSQTTAYSLGLNVDVANGLNEAIFKLSNTFGSLAESGYLENILLLTNRPNSYAAYQKSMGALFLNPSVKNKNAIKKMAAVAMEEYEPGGWSTGHAFHSVYHELGHAVQYMVLDKDAKKRNQIEVLYNRTFSDILGKEAAWTLDPKVVGGLAAKAKEANFSYYGLRNSGEFVAESIAQYFLSDNPSDIAKNVIKILKGE